MSILIFPTFEYEIVMHVVSCRQKLTSLSVSNNGDHITKSDTFSEEIKSSLWYVYAEPWLEEKNLLVLAPYSLLWFNRHYWSFGSMFIFTLAWQQLPLIAVLNSFFKLTMFYLNVKAQGTCCASTSTRVLCFGHCKEVQQHALPAQHISRPSQNG